METVSHQAVFVPVCLLQRTTQPRRMWQATRPTRPIPTPSATTCPTWEPLPGTRRSTAMRSAWRRATVRDASHVRARPVAPPARRWKPPIKIPIKNRNFNEKVSSNWTTALEKWPVRLSVHVTPLDEQIGLFEASLHNHAEETGKHIFFARCCFLNFHPSSSSFSDHKAPFSFSKHVAYFLLIRWWGAPVSCSSARPRASPSQRVCVWGFCRCSGQQSCVS